MPFTNKMGMNDLQKRFYQEPHGTLLHAIEEIRETYGLETYIKPKALHKFGRTENADNGIRTTISRFQDAVVNETYSTTNDIDRIVSTDNGDTEDITIEGHYLDSNGNLQFTVQTVTLTGQTPATIPTPLFRCTRLANTGTTNLAGDVAAFVNGSTTLGKPDTDTSVKCMIIGTAGFNQSEKAATAFSVNDYGVLTSMFCAVTRTGSAVSADVSLERRDAKTGSVFRQIMETTIRSDGISSLYRPFDPPLIVPANNDIRMVVTTTADNTSVTGGFDCYLAARRDPI